jgi:hypothetical protein
MCRWLETSENSPSTTFVNKGEKRKGRGFSQQLRPQASTTYEEDDALAVLLCRLVDSWGSLRKVLGDHDGMDLDSGIQPEEKGFRYGGDLGCIVHVDDDVSASCTLYV